MADFGPEWAARWNAKWGIGSPFASAPAFPQDATSMKGVPLTQGDWNAVFAAAGVAAKTVNQSHALQDAAGGPVATIGTNFSAYGTLNYQDPVAGWTRVGIRNPVSTTAGVGLAAGTGPNPGTQSCLVFCYADLVGAAGANRGLAALSNAGTNNCRIILLQTSGFLRCQCANVNVDGAINHLAGGVHPVILAYNRTAGTVKIYSDLEKITGTYSAAVTDTSGKGYPANAAILGANATYMLSAMFAGADAEWSDADVKAVLQALGWTIPWS